MRGVLLVFAAGGCQALFPLDEPVVPTEPIQQVMDSRKENDLDPVILQPNLTGDGHTLIVIALVRSMSAHIASIDDGVNPWLPALIGNDYSAGTGSPVRAEIWYSPLAAPTDQVTVMAPDKPIGALLIELDLPTFEVTLGAGRPQGDLMSDTASTGDIDITGRTLVISAVTFNTATTAGLTTLGYTELIPIAADDVRAASAVQVLATGPANAEWSLSDPAAHWNTAIVGLGF